jgi:hypothetical protein
MSSTAPERLMETPMSNRAARNKRRQAERRHNAIHLRGELKLMGLSIAIATMLAYVLSNVVGHSPHAFIAFVTFGALTTLLSAGWIRYDAHRAYQFAAERHYLGFEGNPPCVISIAEDCPKRWLVLLYIELNPELISRTPSI